MSDKTKMTYPEWRSLMRDDIGENPGEEALREAWTLYVENSDYTLAVMAYERGVSNKDKVATIAALEIKRDSAFEALGAEMERATKAEAALADAVVLLQRCGEPIGRAMLPDLYANSMQLAHAREKYEALGREIDALVKQIGGDDGQG